MKLLMIAVVAATLGTNVAPALAMGKLSPGVMPLTVGTPTPVERRSGRCPGGELRFFVPGCSGV